MEILDRNDRPRRSGDSQQQVRPRNLFIGLTLVAVGLVWLLNNFNVLTDRAFDVIFSWQTLVILIGGYLLSLRRWVSGGVVAAVGLFLLLVDQLQWHIPLSKIAIPALLIAAGISVMLTRRVGE